MEVGSINGSCNVSVIAAPEEADDNKKSLLTVQMHMDSRTPNLVIIVTCKQGDMDATLDHKIEADLCLLLFPLAQTFGVNYLLDNQEGIVGRALTQHGVDVEHKRKPPQLSDVKSTKERFCVSKSTLKANDNNQQPTTTLPCTIPSRRSKDLQLRSRKLV